MLQAIELRKAYVIQYVGCLQNGKMGGDEKIQEMDAQLNEQTILVFRKLAHAKVQHLISQSYEPPLLIELSCREAVHALSGLLHLVT